jgi:hypothetical protein
LFLEHEAVARDAARGQPVASLAFAAEFGLGVVTSDLAIASIGLGQLEAPRRDSHHPLGTRRFDSRRVIRVGTRPGGGPWCG